MLFATNNRLNLPKAKSIYESLSIPNASTTFVACAGVTDPDVNLSMTIVSSVMLGALPIVAWSMTFRRSTSKAILMFWLLLLAVGHTFYALTISNPSFHYQICPKNHIEPLPTTNFQAPSLDQSWRDSFSSFVSTMQESPRNDSPPACIYTCFATKGYLGRKTQDISVWDGIGVQHPVFKSTAAHRRGGVMFWWSYTLLALLTLFTTEKKGRLPKRLHKLLFLIEYRQQPLASRWNWKNVTNIAIKRTEDPIVTTDSSEATISVKIHITVLKVVQLFTQFISVGVFCGSIISQETQNAQMWSALSQEPFEAVGQWSNLAVVLLVLVAAGVGRIWVSSELGRAVILEGRSLEDGIGKSQASKALNGGKSSIDGAGAKTDCWKDGEDDYVETEKEDWRIGYAS